MLCGVIIVCSCFELFVQELNPWRDRVLHFLQSTQRVAILLSHCEGDGALLLRVENRKSVPIYYYGTNGLTAAYIHVLVV